MSRRIIAVAAVIILAAVGIVGGTLAWFTDQETANNTITTGKVDINLYENGDLIDDNLPGITIGNLMPGDVKKKTVKIELGDGSSAAWIRARVDFNFTDNPNGLTASPDMSELSLIFSPLLWELKSDGWFYYRIPLVGIGNTLFSKAELDGFAATIESAKSAEPAEFAEAFESEASRAIDLWPFDEAIFFTHVRLNLTAGNDYAGRTLAASVIVQAVQVENNLSKVGWPD